MASIPMVLQQIRRARRETRRDQPTGQFREYRPAYREILLAAREAGGEEVLDDIMEWAVDWTKREQRLPEPDTLRAHAREILEAQAIDIPADSPLRNS